jgi:hypothetical protein
MLISTLSLQTMSNKTLLGAVAVWYAELGKKHLRFHIAILQILAVREK